MSSHLTWVTYTCVTSEQIVYFIPVLDICWDLFILIMSDDNCYSISSRVRRNIIIFVVVIVVVSYVMVFEARQNELTPRSHFIYSIISSNSTDVTYNTTEVRTVILLKWNLLQKQFIINMSLLESHYVEYIIMLNILCYVIW